MTPGPTTGRVVVAGSLNLDLTLTVPRLPAPGETVSAHGRADGPGGKGLNQAVAAARAGAPTAFVGCLGGDDAGRRLLAVLVGEGIDAAAVRVEAGLSSGVAVVAVDGAGSNSIVVVAGANAEVGADDTGSVAVTADDVLVTQGEIPPAAALAFVRSGRRAGARTIVNLAPFHPPSAELLSATSIVVVNETELVQLMGTAPARDGDPAALGIDTIVGAARRVLGRGPDTVVVTLGERGLIAVTATEVLDHPARAVVVVDTTGAGDAVVGVLAAGLAAGRPLGTALHAATVAASLVVGRPGAALAMATRAEIDGAGEIEVIRPVFGADP